jgi:N-acetylmuramoyl-L-alanine amidase
VFWSTTVTALVALVLAAWPRPDAPLTAPELPPFTLSRRLKVVIDAGHGVGENHGNTGCFCQLEQDATLDTARLLADALRDTGFFQVKLARADTGPSYPARLEQAERFEADAVISLHTDARGEAFPWRPYSDEQVCYRNPAEPGFAVLYSEDGDEAMVARRARLGRSLSARLAGAGFLAYDGVNYGGLYRRDEADGVFIDKRPRATSVYFLRGSAKVPVVIIETHHALDAQEVLRWTEQRTHEVFARAVARALLDLAEAQHVAWLR